MKTKFLTHRLFTLLLLATIALISCSKDNDRDNPSAEVVPKDLLDYYVVFETDAQRCYVLYFAEDNGKITAYIDGLGVHRGFEVTLLTDETLRFEYNEGVFFNFNFDKNNGGVALTGYATSGTDVSITHAQSDKTANAPVFYNDPENNVMKIFSYTKTVTHCSQTDKTEFIYFVYNNGPGWQYDGSCGPSDFLGYYFVGDRTAWKGNDETVFGAIINDWKGSKKPTMVLESFINEMQPGRVHTAFQF